MQGFKFALSMFPNKVRCENVHAIDERRIVTLIKEEVIKEIPPSPEEFVELINNYKQIK